jgi:hypothetical protein
MYNGKITDSGWIAEVEAKRAALPAGYVLIAVWQNASDVCYSSYSVFSNASKKELMLACMNRSATKTTKTGTLQQMAYYLERGRQNEIWELFCGYVFTGGRKNPTTVKETSDTLYREVSL